MGVRKVDFQLYLITDRHQTRGRPLNGVLKEALRAGVKAVQLREKDLATRPLLALAHELRDLTADFGAKLFINDRVDLCLAVGADGVHLRGESLPSKVVRGLVGDEKLIGVSAHSLDEARQAQVEGADFAVLGPVYRTPSKVAYGPPLGPQTLKAVKRYGLTIPVFAIGGIKLSSIKAVLEAGAEGVALIRAIMAARHIERAVQDLLAEIARFQRPARTRQ